MPLHLLRRHRRPLFFPPGLLALAGLLWLGCTAIRLWQHQLKLSNVMQITMPPLQVIPGHPDYDRNSPMLAFYKAMPYTFSASKLRAFRPWRDAYFIGNSDADRREQTWATTAVQAMLADYGHRGGVRVRFAPTARYEQLIFALDLMNRAEVKKWWLDARHEPTTLYAITDIRPRPYLGSNPDFFSSPIIPYYPSSKPAPTPLQMQLDNWVMNFWQFQWLQPLAQPEWLATIGLLSTIMILGSWRMLRARFVL